MQMPIFIQKINHKFILVTPRLIRKKPLLLIRLLWKSLFAYSGSGGGLRSILFHTHYMCNLNCRHCYEKNFTRTNEKPLTLAEKKKIISDCLELGVLSFDFVSGESSLDPELPELIKACRPERTYVTLATNGYDFTEERIKYFLDIGVDKMNISIDSWHPEEHDAIRRKKGSHRNAFNTLELCKKLGMGFQITVFVYRNSTKTDGFKKLVEYAVKNRVRLTFKAAVPLGAWEAEHENLITENDRELMFSLHEKYPFLIRTCIGNRSRACPAFDRLIAITAYGDVLPCNTIHISFGNLRTDDLRTVINKGKRAGYLNGCYKGCPPADDRQFITSYLCKTYNADPYPIKAEDVFEEIKT